MKLPFLLPLVLAFAAILPAHGADVQVIAGGALTVPMKELASQFEASSGHKLSIRYGTTPELIAMAKSSPFDLAVTPREVFHDADAAKRMTPGPSTDICRVGLGVAVRSGAPKPDIGTPEALKQALLKANSIATIPASAAGAQVTRLFERLGLTDTLKERVKAALGPAKLVELVASGEAELGVFLTNVLTADGLDLVGPVPAELNQEIVFTAAPAADAAQAEAARAFLTFLQTPAAKALLRARGLTPG